MSFFVGRLSERWQAATRVELAWLLGCALLFWAGKWGGKFFEGIPGHSAAFWIPALFLAGAGVPRPGAGTFTALLGGGLWCLPGGNSLGWAGYVAAALVLDLLAVRPARLRWLPAALLAGALCGLAKFSFYNLPAAVIGAGGRFISWGLAPVALLHLLFGLLGGLIGWLLIRRLAPPPAARE